MIPTRLPIGRGWVEALEQNELISVAAGGTAAGRCLVFANHNLHSLHLMARSRGMSRFYQRADRVHIDGMPIVWFLRLAGWPVSRRHRHTSPDWIRQVLAACAAGGRRIFIIGGQPEVFERFRALVQEWQPGLLLDGHHGYFSRADEPALLQRIAAHGTELLLLGMGMPRQEEWFISVETQLPPCVVMNLGAFMDYWVGVQSMPPRFLGKHGLEWCWRLLSNPRRLSYRYLVEPVLLLPELVSSTVKAVRLRRRGSPLRMSRQATRRRV